MKRLIAILMIPWGIAAAPPPPLLGELGCGVCHPGLPVDKQVFERSGPLADVRARFTPVELFEYLQNPKPKRSETGVTRMPDFRFRPEESLALTLFLSGSDEGLETIRATQPAVTAEAGQRIYRNQNCGGCHLDASLPKPDLPVAPLLSFEGARAKRPWLEAFLAHPVSIRPFGYLPGTGSRMPDFGLSSEEVQVVSDWLMAQTHPQLVEKEPPGALSAFSAKKAKALLTERYACLGCHQLEGKGGRIGPDLTSVSTRRSGAYVQALIENPEKFAAGHVMPKIPMPAKTSELIAAYLIGAEAKAAVPEDAQLVKLDAEATAPTQDGAGLYQRYCAACHGATGKGDGFNAVFLDPRPSVHADPGVARIPDDTLFDGIHGGGFILNKSPAMPPWGTTLNHAQIRRVVAHIRTLCQCEGPEWSK